MILISKEILDEIDEWAKNYNGKVDDYEQIEAIYYSDNDIKENRERLFIITDRCIPFSLEKAIKKSGFGIELQVFPCSHRRAKNPGFHRLFNYAEN